MNNNNKNLFSNEDLKDVLSQLNELDDDNIISLEETQEMKAAKLRYEEYLLKHKDDNN